MANTIREYLDEVEDRLRGTISLKALQLVLAETESHLRESAAEIETLGFTPVEAEQRAVSCFGEAEKYGESLEKVEPARVWAAPKSWALRASCLATALFLLWPLLIRNFPYYHYDETLKGMWPAMIPIVGLFMVAFLGSRIQARKLFAISLIGGALLVPVLAVRFVGSMHMGGIVVRSIELRETEEEEPSFFDKQALINQTALTRFNRLSEDFQAGHLPSYRKGADAFHRAVQYLGDTHVQDWAGAPIPLPHPSSIETYVVPQKSPRGLTTASDAFGETLSAEEAMRAWLDDGQAVRKDHESSVEVYTRWARDARARLAEPFWYRLTSMRSWGLVFALVWGSLLCLVQALGTNLRRLAMYVLELIVPDLRPGRPTQA